MKHTLHEMNISHVTTSYHHPNGDSKIEQFHLALQDVMLKKVSDSLDTWDIYLNQVLTAIRLNINESTQFPPFYLLHNHAPVLSIDNILKPRRRYLGEEPHMVGSEQQYKSFAMVQQHLKKIKEDRQGMQTATASTQSFRWVTLSILNSNSGKVSVGGVSSLCYVGQYTCMRLESHT